MRREDLFHAIGMVDNKQLFRCDKLMNPSVFTLWEDSNMSNGKYSENARPRRIKTVWLIAAIIALMLLLMGSAIAALVTMRVEEVEMHGQTGGKHDTEEVSTDDLHEEETVKLEEVYEGEKISFDAVHDVFIELGAYYPQEIPEGYTMTFFSNDAPLQNQVIHYENDAGDLIKYWLYVGSPASSIEIYEIEKRTEVDINGQHGILYEQKGGRCTLVWINSTKGYGLALQANDPAVDFLAMAESTAEGEPLTSTRSDETVKALEELGDFNPEYLPEGFEELSVQGSPLSEGSNWYSYVRKWYVNKAENTNIYFEYETYVIVTEDGYTDDARTACSFYIPGYTVGEEVEINGMFGIADKNDIAWADPEAHVVYHLHSEDISEDELLKIAQSIIRNQ